MHNWETHLSIISTITRTSILNSKVIQISLKPILSGEAGIHEEAFFVIPFFEAAVVEQLQIILDDEGHNVML